MRKPMLMSAVLAASLLAAQTAAPPKPEAPPLKVNVGDVAPDFILKVYDGKQMSDVSLAQFRGKKNVILAFFVFAFTGG